MSSGTRVSRRRWGWVVALLLLVLLLVGFALGLAAAPLAGLPANARAAQQALGQAQTAAENGNLDRARAKVSAARAEVADARDRTEGARLSVLAAVPVIGSAVSDARHLVAALDDGTTVAELGIDLYAPLAGKSDTPLFEDGRFDLAVLGKVISGAQGIGRAAGAAQDELDQVRGDAPVVGGRIREARDQAAERITPVAEGYRRAEPVLAALPRMLGAQQRSSYLIALLNPGELRWSGGIPLAFSSATVENGRAEFGETTTTRDVPGRWVPRPFPPVRKNPFHTALLPRLTYNPDWSVSGREQLKGWQLATGDSYQTIVALDIPAIAELLRVTGPVEVPVYGKVTADNLVELQATSYDRIADTDTRDQLNGLLVAAVRERLLSGSHLAAVARTMYRMAQERHLAVVSRDETIDAALTSAGMGGQLTETPHDYLTAFSMSYGGSKAGYWEKRLLSSRVRLAADGSATVRTGVRLVNDAPPYRGPGEDPRTGYQTRWTNLLLLRVLPRGATVTGGPQNRSGGANPSLGGRGWVRQNIELPPNDPQQLALDYTVPRASTVDGDRLTYRLTYDPQGMVHEQRVRVRVRFPEGYDAAALPEGWTRTDDGAAFSGTPVEPTTWTLALRR